MAKVSLRAYDREIESMIDRSQLDEAIAHCQHILKTFPKHLETYRLLGKAFLEYKRYKDAVDIFTRVLTVEPNDFVANVGMSIIRDEEDKLDDAIWHMERAFEVQSANAAIQGELQRLYGRREGVQPPRIRMTRGALAQMYVQGELYPQAISEIKGVLAEDAGRTDMQVLMARAYFRSGQKTEAADTASTVLRRYPYCLDANRILVEILGADRPENSQLYRQRVIELDPYAAQVSGTIFQSNEVGDAAISLEHFEWDGKSAETQSDWRSAQAISLDSGFGAQNAQAEPDWLKGGFADDTPLQAAPNVVPPLPVSDSSFDFLAPSPAAPTIVPPSSASDPSFDFLAPLPAASEPAPAQPTPEADIPDFLKAAGWGQSTGAFDESKISFDDEPVAAASASDAMPIAQGDMPDWLKAMAPPLEAAEPVQPAEEEVLPDWINKIDKGTLSAAGAAAASDDLDWLNPTDEPSQPAAQTSDVQLDWMNQPASQPSASNDQFDWLSNLGNEPASTPAQSADDQPDWMKQLGQPASSAPADDLDWLSNLGNEPAAAPAQQPEADQPDWINQLDQPASQAPAGDQPDWLSNLGSESESGPAQSADDQPDWMKQFAEPAASSASTGDEFDFLNELTQPASSAPSNQPPVLSQPPAPEPVQPLPAAQPAANTADLGKSQSDIDDSLAWFESLAAKQGATEGLLIKPEDRKDVEPDWIQKIKNSTQTPAQQPPAVEAPAETALPPQAQLPAESEPVQAPIQQIPVPQPAANVADLGKSQSDIDDSLAWFESLAAKQGATEGLLIKPEDRKDVEPDWIQKIKNSTQAPTPQPDANVAAPLQAFPASEPPPIEFNPTRADIPISPPQPPAPEPVQQQLSVPQPPVEQAPAAQPVANVADLGKSQSDIDDSLAWFESLAAKQGATEGLLIKPEDRKDVEPDWIQKIKNSSQAPAPQPSAPEPVQPSPAPPVAEVAPPSQPPAPAPIQQQPPTAQPAANVADLGKSQSDIDDSLAWFESLAAKQGATEGLLIKPEDRKDVEPDWIQKIKNSTQAPVQPLPAKVESPSQPPAPEPVQQQPVVPPTSPVAQPVANVADLGKSQSDIDDSLAWFESLAARQGATEGLLIKPEDRKEVEPDWIQKIKNSTQPPAQQPAQSAPLVEQQPVDQTPQVTPPAVPASTGQASTADDTDAWLRSLDEEESKPEAETASDDTAMWFKKLDEPEPVSAPQADQADDIPAWLQGVDEEKAPAAESAPPANAAAEHFDTPAPAEAETDIPSWLKGVDEESKAASGLPQDDLPAWMRDETGEVVAEPTKIEPTRSTDWHPMDEKPLAPPAPQLTPEPVEPVLEKPKLEPVKKSPPKPAAPEPYKEPVTRVRGTGMLTMPPVDPILASARNELSRSNIPGALETYEKLIKKGRFLDEVIFDLREALYRYPVEVSIWQALGDAYMRANRLQDALDAYTKAEELLR